MYILITPAKNEELFLPKVADSVINQTIKPLVWVIVDDGSTDGTPDIIKNLKCQYHWIKSIRLPPHPWDITFHYSYVCKNGFDYVVQLCEKNSIKYNFIGLLDADTVLEKTFAEKLLLEFYKNKHLGIASGDTTYIQEGEICWNNIINNEPDKRLPSGSGRFWRKECFFETDGYLVEPAPDSISSVKAILKSWDIRRFGHIRAIQLRQASSGRGLWNGFWINGKIAYYLNKHPLLVLLGSFFYLTQNPYYIGFAYFCGYIQEWFKGSEKINDPEIRDYYWNKKLYEWIHNFS